MFESFIHIVACNRIPLFLRLNNIPLNVHVTFVFSLHL
jgi:hypothetical protein